MSGAASASDCFQFPEIIQGGMGVGISSWSLARAVSMAGGIGVVSGTALDTVLIRRLQDGDPDGSMRMALAAFPFQEMVAPILAAWFIPEEKSETLKYQSRPLPTAEMSRMDEELLIVGSFVEVYLAKQGQGGMVGVNLLEKIQLTALPTLFGAMLAGVDVVIMGGGIPVAIPEVLEGLAQLRPVELKLHVEDVESANIYTTSFHPGTYVPVLAEALKQPLFFAVVSSHTLARALVKKTMGRVDGFIVESHKAGGHNAPPRRDGVFGPRDECSTDCIADLGLPFWLAGGRASPERLQAALNAGASGVQIGSAFACSDESGMLPEIKQALIVRALAGKLEVITDFQASPTGYPFKRANLGNDRIPKNCRVCDLGYLRQIYEQEPGLLGYRCSASLKKSYLRRGGSEAETEGKYCLCNGLLATIGLGQVRKGQATPPLVTIGEDLSFLKAFLEEGATSYTATEFMAWLRPAKVQANALCGER
ncbi:MAG: nitronate monooxygenase [Verrucomicrobiota bacterium]